MFVFNVAGENMGTIYIPVVLYFIYILIIVDVRAKFLYF